MSNMKIVNKGNINGVIKDYLNQVNSIRFPVPPENKVEFIRSLKRDPLGSGPYEDVSFFESGNRILSDLVLLYGTRNLLFEKNVAGVKLPFKEYSIRMGIEDGYDIEARARNRVLIGEAFNASRSYFQTKKGEVVDKLRREKASFRIVVFNVGAIKNEDHYIRLSKASMLFLPISI